MSSKPVLGKGLEALLKSGAGDAAGASDVKESPGGKKGRKAGEVLLLSMDLVDAGREQPRKKFSREALEELAESIKAQGVLQPILVEKAGDRYRIIAGERRFRACRLAGLGEIPAIVRDFSPGEKLEAALIENIQREDLNPLEEALAYRAIMDAGKLSQEETAKKVGKNRSTVANALRLLRLDKDMQEALTGGEFTPGHARAVLSLENPADRRILFSRIMETGMSVREAEQTAGELAKGKRAGKAKKTAAPRALPPELREIEQRFIDVFGTKVKIKGDNNSGQIEISYLSMADLERITEIIS